MANSNAINRCLYNPSKQRVVRAKLYKKIPRVSMDMGSFFFYVKVMRIVSYIIFLTVLSGCYKETALQSIPAHSHNDYLQETPLFKALNKHFKSIEADIYEVGDSLFVAHDLDKIQKGHTLRQLYLEPLHKAISKKNLEYELFLLVDIKREGQKVYPHLEKILEDYKDILTHFQNGKVFQGAVRVIISGDRPAELMQQSKKRYTFLDGRISLLEQKDLETLVPLYSDDWADYFQWDGTGQMPKDEKKKLDNFVSQAKGKNAWLRFWNTPNASVEQRKNLRKVLSDYDNVLIGTDNIDETALFFVKKTKKRQ